MSKGGRGPVKVEFLEDLPKRINHPMLGLSSIFSQIIRLVPRGLFDKAVGKHKAEKHAKGMTSWSQFIALMFCQLGGARSLREIVGGLAASEGKLKLNLNT